MGDILISCLILFIENNSKFKKIFFILAIKIYNIDIKIKMGNFFSSKRLFNLGCKFQIQIISIGRKCHVNLKNILK